MERKTGQLSFLDSLTADIGGRRTAEFFQKCNKLIPWQLLAQPLKDMYRNNTDIRLALTETDSALGWEVGWNGPSDLLRRQPFCCSYERGLKSNTLDAGRFHFTGPQMTEG